MRQEPCLTVKNQDTGEIYLQIPVSEADRFSVGFVHSVNKTPVTNYYETMINAALNAETQKIVPDPDAQIFYWTESED